jgi:hypothetical protein
LVSSAWLAAAKWPSGDGKQVTLRRAATHSAAHSEPPSLASSAALSSISALAYSSDDESVPPLSSATAGIVFGAATTAWAADSGTPSLVSSVAMSSLSALAYSDEDSDDADSVPDANSVEDGAVVITGAAAAPPSLAHSVSLGSVSAGVNSDADSDNETVPPFISAAVEAVVAGVAPEPAALPAPDFARAPSFDAYLKEALPPPPSAARGAPQPSSLAEEPATTPASYDIGEDFSDYWHPGTLAAGAVLLSARLGAMAAAKATRSARALWSHASDAADAAPACARACARAAAHVAADPKLSIAAVVLLGGPLAAMGAMEAAGLRSRVTRAEADIAALRSEVGAVQAAMQAQRAPLASHGFRTSWQRIPIN